MTREELRKIFDDAEKKVCTPENYAKIVAELTDSTKIPPDDEKAFALRVNPIIEREMLFEVLATILVDK